MKTIKDYTTDYLHYGLITVPAGTIVTHNTAIGFDRNYHFVDEFAWIEDDYPHIKNILKMDTMRRGLNVPKEFVEYDQFEPEIKP